MFHTHLFHSAATRRRCPPTSSVPLYRESVALLRLDRSPQARTPGELRSRLVPLAHGTSEALGSLERLLSRFHLDEGVASEELFGLGEWPSITVRFSPEYLIRQPSKLVAVRRHRATLPLPPVPRGMSPWRQRASPPVSCPPPSLSWP